MASPPPPNAPPTSLFVGNLDPRVYRELLEEIFTLGGSVNQCHVVFDKATGLSSGFGFVDYADNATAQSAMEKFRGRTVYGKTLTIDWARASGRDATRAEEAAAHTLFVGNLSPDVLDAQLMTAFAQFGSCVSAKCAKDPMTNKTQGFAFVAFQQRAHAAAAMDAMNGQVLNNRPLRVEWARGKTGGATRATASGPSDAVMEGGRLGGEVGRGDGDTGMLSVEAVAAQTSPNNITAYVAGLKVSTPEERIRERFAPYGEIREIRIPESVKAQATETMYAFVRYVEHDAAARAIADCQRGTEIDGKMVQVHWGRENVRRPVMSPAGRGAPYGMQGYMGGFQPQQPYPPQQYHHQPYGQRPAYGAQPYGRGLGHAAGPMHRQPHVAAQHRYCPY